MGTAVAVMDPDRDVKWVHMASAALRNAVAGLSGDVADVVGSVAARADAVAVHLPALGPLSGGTTERLIPLMSQVYDLACDYAGLHASGSLGTRLQRGRLDLRGAGTLGDAYLEQMRAFDRDVAGLAELVATIRGEERLAESGVVASSTPDRWTRDHLIPPPAAPEPEEPGRTAPGRALVIAAAIVLALALIGLLSLTIGGRTAVSALAAWSAT